MVRTIQRFSVERRKCRKVIWRSLWVLHICATCNDDSYRKENVTNKENSRVFKLVLIFQLAENGKSIVQSSWSWILGDCRKVYKERGRKISRRYFTSSMKRRWSQSHLVGSSLVTAKKFTKKPKSVMHMYSCCFALSHCFFDVLVPVSVVVAKASNCLVS